MDTSKKRIRCGQTEHGGIIDDCDFFPLKDSPALRRLIEEVKVDNEPVTDYNRTYHRHNR